MSGTHDDPYGHQDGHSGRHAREHRIGIVINLAASRLFRFDGSGGVETYPVSVGRSQGCFAFSGKDHASVMDLLGPDRLILAVKA